MARFFLLFGLALILSVGMASPAVAIGIANFVAVSDGTSCAAYNPAGLAAFEGNAINLDYRVTGYDNEAFGWDHLLVYASSNRSGSGALFVGYSQDFLGSLSYQRINSFGYSFGWKSSDRLAVGLTGKFVTDGSYEKTGGTLNKVASENAFLFDFGTKFALTDKLSMGLLVADIGSGSNYQITVGFAYRTGPWVVAGEVYDLTNQAIAPFGGSLIRFGGRYALQNWNFELALETSDWSYNSQSVILTYAAGKSLVFGVSWTKIASDLIDDNSVQVSMGYRF